MSIRKEIKMLLLQENSTITEIAKKMSEKTNKKYTMRSLAQKLTRESLKVNEYKLIADILGYEIKLVKKQKT